MVTSSMMRKASCTCSDTRGSSAALKTARISSTVPFTSAASPLSKMLMRMCGTRKVVNALSRLATFRTASNTLPWIPQERSMRLRNHRESQLVNCIDGPVNMTPFRSLRCTICVSYCVVVNGERLSRTLSGSADHQEYLASSSSFKGSFAGSAVPPAFDLSSLAHTLSTVCTAKAARSCILGSDMVLSAPMQYVPSSSVTSELHDST